ELAVAAAWGGSDDGGAEPVLGAAQSGDLWGVAWVGGRRCRGVGARGGDLRGWETTTRGPWEIASVRAVGQATFVGKHAKRGKISKLSCGIPASSRSCRALRASRCSGPDRATKQRQFGTDPPPSSRRQCKTGAPSPQSNQ